MKMTKKILLGAFAVLAFAFTSCDGLLGGEEVGQTSGRKWDKELVMDSSASDATYNRIFKAISTSKSCSAVETTVTVLEEDAVLVGETSKAVVGLAFDVHYDKATQSYDFVLVGIQADTAKYYVERYVGVTKADFEEAASADIGGTATFLDGKAEGKFYCDNPVEAVLDDDGNRTWTIGVTQDVAFTYEVAINGSKVASYEVAEEDKVEGGKLTKSKGKQVGAVYVYGNAPKGTKYTAKFTSNKDATVGLMEDAE